MKKTTLVVMAAGMGSRFGGLKQIEPVGEGNRAILDYSVYDAKEAGFDKVVFIIKKEIEKDFRDTVGKRIENMIDVDYVFQSLDKIPAGFKLPENRVKPLGTGHAILCAKEAVNTPFAVINADDYYGKQGYKIVNEHLKNSDEYAMVAFELMKTVTDNGTVARGVCHTEDGYLKTVTEITNINSDGTYEDAENKKIQLPENTLVSMNLFGLNPSIFGYLEDGLTEFLKNNADNIKSEYFLPTVIDGLIKAGKEKVKMLSTPDKWYGVTYREDLETVKAAIAEFTRQGLYN